MVPKFIKIQVHNFAVDLSKVSKTLSKIKKTVDTIFWVNGLKICMINDIIKNVKNG